MAEGLKECLNRLVLASGSLRTGGYQMSETKTVDVKDGNNQKQWIVVSYITVYYKDPALSCAVPVILLQTVTILLSTFLCLTFRD